MKRVIIGCPFGNYLTFPGATSADGTFTWDRRGGLLWRLWRVASTVSYDRKQQSWMNKLGLPNPGIRSLKYLRRDRIVSIHGFGLDEWILLVNRCQMLLPLAVELNFSCPNVDAMTIGAIVQAAEYACKQATPVIVKLPPLRWQWLGEALHKVGVRHFHLCNTIPSPGGGISGKPLMQYSLWACNDFRKMFGDTVELIGGGGITCLDDVKRYRDAGADRIAVASMLFNPFNHRKIEEFVAYLENEPWDESKGLPRKAARE